MFRIKCSSCGAELEVTDSESISVIKCPSCGVSMELDRSRANSKRSKAKNQLPVARIVGGLFLALFVIVLIFPHLWYGYLFPVLGKLTSSLGPLIGGFLYVLVFVVYIYFIGRLFGYDPIGSNEE